MIPGHSRWPRWIQHSDPMILKWFQSSWKEQGKLRRVERMWKDIKGGRNKKSFQTKVVGSYTVLQDLFSDELSQGSSICSAHLKNTCLLALSRRCPQQQSLGSTLPFRPPGWCMPGILRVLRPLQEMDKIPWVLETSRVFFVDFQIDLRFKYEYAYSTFLFFFLKDTVHPKKRHSSIGSTRSPPQGVSWSTERAYVPWGLVRISGVLAKHLRKGTLCVAVFLCLVQPKVDSMDLYYTHTHYNHIHIYIYILDIQLAYSPRLLDFCFDQSQRLCLMKLFRHVGWFGKFVAWRFWVPQCDFGSDSICDSAVDALLDLCPAYLGGLDVHLQAPLNCKWLLYWMFSNWCQRT